MNIKKIFTTTLKSLLVVILFSIFTGCNAIKTDLLLPQLMVLRKALATVGLATEPNAGAGNPNTPVVTIDAPTFSPAAGTYSSAQSVTISTTTTTGAILCYTTDGSTPSCDSTPTCTSGTLYSSPVSIATTTKLKALACKAGNLVSAVGTGDYVIGSGIIGLVYSSSAYTFQENIAIATITPTVTETVTSCSAIPTLPTGLSINNTTCAISGTPTTSQAATAYTITASKASGSTTASINITITALSAPSALTYSSSAYTFQRNAAIATITPTVTGTVTSCSASPVLPSGLSINATTCAISGTPTINQGSTAYTISASNADGSTTATFSIIVQTVIYKIFVTASTFNGDLMTAGAGGDGPTGADNLCNSDANKPNTSSYKAILFANIRTAIPTSDWVLLANTTYVRGSDSALIFTTNASSNFTFGALTNSFDSVAQKQYWTGFRGVGNEWELGLYRCNEWESSSAIVTGRFGLSDATSYSSISTGAQNNCNTSKYLLCAEQ